MSVSDGPGEISGSAGGGRSGRDRFTLATMAVDTKPEGILFHLLGNDTPTEGEARAERSGTIARSRENIES